MRFMLIVKSDERSDAGVLPSAKELADMGRFNVEMLRAGVMLGAEGLQTSGKGARVRFTGRTPTVVDGPFPEAEELVAGFWLIQTRSKEEAIDWARRVPFHDGEIEVRQVFELEELGSTESSDRYREGRQRLARGY